MFWFKKKEIINEKEILKERLLNELNKLPNVIQKQAIKALIEWVFR